MRLKHERGAIYRTKLRSVCNLRQLYIR